MERQRDQAKRLQALIDRNLVLCKGKPDQRLAERIATLEREIGRIWEARSQLQLQTAHLAAGWAVELALGHKCRLIGAENLKTLEPRLRGARLRDRLNHQIRGILLKHMADKAAEAGIGLIDQINPRTTSSHCPRCAAPHTHVRAPDNLASGRGWACCPSCGSSIDRDHAAALRIGAKALSDISSREAPCVQPREPSRRGRRSGAPNHTASLTANRSPKLDRLEKPRVAHVRSRHRRDPDRPPKRTRLRTRALNNHLHRSTRRRSQGAGSRAAVTPATQPVRRTTSRSTHCETGTKGLPGFKLARATRTRMPQSTLVNT
jgi:hypothetical protein